MTTDSERRRVADALMFLTLRPSMGKRGEHADLCRACGCEGATWRDLFLRLADLIEPSDHIGDPDKMVDRDALLALADEMENVRSGYTAKAWFTFNARRIREALGVCDGR